MEKWNDDYEEFNDEISNDEVDNDIDKDDWKVKYHLVNNQTKENDIYPDDNVYRQQDENKAIITKKSSLGITKKLFTALLVCLLGLSSGYGGAYLFNKTHKNDNTVIYQQTSTNTPTLVSGDGIEKEDVIENVQDSVVQIETEAVKTGGFFGNYVTSGAGSGVIITANGYIVTNYHVIEDATKVTVTLANNKKYPGSIIGYDEDNDIAVIKIEENNLNPAIIGDSDNLKVGQSVLVIGNPLGTLGGSVTSGIVSALSRDITVENHRMNLLQIDAAVNPGNSGGALFDLAGNLVGIVNAKYQSNDTEGIGFAIPINTAKNIVEQLMSQGYVDGKVALGISIVDVNNEYLLSKYEFKEMGIYVVIVNPGSDAENGGLEVYDRIISVDGIEVKSGSEISPIVKSHSVGDVVHLVVIRDGQTLNIDIKLTEQAKIPN